jgi:hypothetical protein
MWGGHPAIGVNLTSKHCNDVISNLTQLPISPDLPHPGFADAKPPLPLARGGD